MYNMLWDVVNVSVYPRQKDWEILAINERSNLISRQKCLIFVKKFHWFYSNARAISI